MKKDEEINQHKDEIENKSRNREVNSCQQNTTQRERSLTTLIHQIYLTR